MFKKISYVGVSVVAFLALCAITAAPNVHAAESTGGSIDAELLEVWNRTDLHVHSQNWPGKMKIKGNWGTIKEASRAVKLYKADILEPFASQYSQDEYMVKTVRQTQSILGGYSKKTSEDMTRTFLASPWAKRYMRQYYAALLAKDCDEGFSEADKTAFYAFFTLTGPSPALWSCPSNPDLKELPLP